MNPPNISASTGIAWSITIAILLYCWWPGSLRTSLGQPLLHQSHGTHILIEARARYLASHSWEYGTISHALLSLYSPELTVFSPSAFPNDRIPTPRSSPLPPGLAYAKDHISTTTPTLFSSDESSVSDPMSLGAAALLLEKTDDSYSYAVHEQMRHLWASLKHPNGAISHREDAISLWADAVAMVPPFLALWAVKQENIDYLEKSIDQIRAYRAELLIPHQGSSLCSKSKQCSNPWRWHINDNGPIHGSWRHILFSPPRATDDSGPWSTSNAWALWGITRVLATIIHWRPAHEAPHFPFEARISELTFYAKEIIDAGIRTDNHTSGLLRNYWGNETYSGETSGTTLMTAAVYRLAALNIKAFGGYLAWAKKKRDVVEGRVRDDGVVGPAANALNHFDPEPLEGGSAEGQAFMLELVAATRDWEKMRRSL